ncbi:hypothetical protein WR25_24804 [Diploscapter pachys]|uniref:Uncharacterized protein n=1 Tax=Diploscapter pachys TaxID=2018661 RepID=A0A2A2KC66_9BILA|nr:hypothetical protein WR25_24804 [Diploscapter pachys]
MSENSLKSEKKKKRSSGNFKERKTDVESTLIKHTEGQKWYSYQVNKLSQGPQNLDDQAVRTLFQEAEQLYNQEVVNYVKEAQKSGGSEASWLFQVLKKGTAQDKMSAVQLQTHTSPIHALQYIQFMIESVEEKKIRDAMQYIPILEDVFLNVYLPPERKLVTFSSRPLSSLKDHPKDDQKRKKSLILWIFEHQLKLIYEKFIRALGNCAGGNVEDLNKKSLKTILNLLAERPEGEQREKKIKYKIQFKMNKFEILLTMLVNKLGHPNYKIGSFTENLVEELARRQPAMRSVIVKEIERLIYRQLNI